MKKAYLSQYLADQTCYTHYPLCINGQLPTVYLELANFNLCICKSSSLKRLCLSLGGLKPPTLYTVPFSMILAAQKSSGIKSTIKTLKLDAQLKFVWEIGYTHEKQADFILRNWWYDLSRNHDTGHVLFPKSLVKLLVWSALLLVRPKKDTKFKKSIFYWFLYFRSYF